MDKESITKELEELNKDKAGIYGEFSHKSMIKHLAIDTENVSHKISNVLLKENSIEGDVEFFESEKGKAALDMIENGTARFGIRATGYRYTENGENIVKVKRIFTWDIVQAN